MKKLWMLCVCGLLSLALVACGGKDSSTGVNDGVQQEQQENDSESKSDNAVVADKTDVKQSEQAQTQQSQQSQSDKDKSDVTGESTDKVVEENEENKIFAPENFAEVVLCDTDKYAIKVNKIEYDEDYYVYFKLINKSKEQLRFEMYSPSVNDVMYENAAVSLTFYETIDAGGEGEASARFRTRDLEKMGVGNISEIGCMLRVIDSQWNKLQDEAYVIYPMGEEAVVEYVYEVKDTDILLVSGDGYSVYATGFGVDSREYVIDFYMENNTDSLLSVRTSPNAINHIMFDNYIFADITAGRKAFMQMCIDDDNMSVVGLESFDDIVKISTLLTCDLGGQNVFEDVVSMYPNGQETAEMKQPQLNGELLFENDVFAIYHTSSGSEKKNFCLGICVVNKTDSLTRVDFQNLTLNGVEYGNLFSSVNIMRQSRCNTVLKWNMDTMKNLGVDRMETFKIDMAISDEQTYRTLYEGSVEGKEFEK